MQIVVLSFVLIGLLVSCAPAKQTGAPGQPTTESLVAYYQFEGNGKDQVGGNHAKYFKDAPLKYSYVDEVHKKAVNFSIPNRTRAVIDNMFDYEHKTICLRVKADVIDDNPAVVIVSDNPRKQFGLFGVVIKEEFGEKKLFFNIASNPVSVPIVEGEWYHVTLLGAGRNYKYYLNGSLIAQGTFNEYKNSAQGAVATILGSSRAFTIFFSGSLDDLRIYNRALSAEEITVIAAN
jgi:hypothetical protein